jgi:hypothetical protein
MYWPDDKAITIISVTMLQTCNVLNRPCSHVPEFLAMEATNKIKQAPFYAKNIINTTAAI